MRLIIFFWFAIFISISVSAQSDFQSMVDADRGISNAALHKGIKNAYVTYLSDDGILFRPTAVNGKDFWRLQPEPPASTLIRSLAFADIAANGLLGYTTGTWVQTTKTPKGDQRQLGQYVTIWSKRPDGRYLATVEITTKYDESDPHVTNPILPTNIARDLNKRRWSAADPSMNFYKAGMYGGGLGGAYDKFAGPDVRLLLEDSPPIFGKESVVRAMKRYRAVAFPKKVALIESADMAYTWNPCEYQNSDEGMEQGNCLHVWKLRDKKWYIVLGVFNRVTNTKKPELKLRSRPTEANGRVGP